MADWIVKSGWVTYRHPETPETTLMVTSLWTQKWLLSSHSATAIWSSAADAHHSSRFTHLHTECCSWYTSHFVLTTGGQRMKLGCWTCLKAFSFFVFNAVLNTFASYFFVSPLRENLCNKVLNFSQMCMTKHYVFMAIALSMSKC